MLGLRGLSYSNKDLTVKVLGPGLTGATVRTGGRCGRPPWASSSICPPFLTPASCLLPNSSPGLVRAKFYPPTFPALRTSHSQEYLQGTAGTARWTVHQCHGKPQRGTGFSGLGVLVPYTLRPGISPAGSDLTLLSFSLQKLQGSPFCP